MRARRTGELADYVNEVPVLFGDDPAIMSQYRRLVGNEPGEPHKALVALAIAIARRLGLSGIEESDFANYLRYEPKT